MLSRERVSGSDGKSSLVFLGEKTRLVQPSDCIKSSGCGGTSFTCFGAPKPGAAAAAGLTVQPHPEPAGAPGAADLSLVPCKGTHFNGVEGTRALCSSEHPSAEPSTHVHCLEGALPDEPQGWIKSRSSSVQLGNTGKKGC